MMTLMSLRRTGAGSVLNGMIGCTTLEIDVFADDGAVIADAIVAEQEGEHDHD